VPHGRDSRPRVRGTLHAVRATRFVGRPARSLLVELPRIRVEILLPTVGNAVRKVERR